MIAMNSDCCSYGIDRGCVMCVFIALSKQKNKEERTSNHNKETEKQQ